MYKPIKAKKRAKIYEQVKFYGLSNFYRPYKPRYILDYDKSQIILDMILNSGEIPTDLYKLLDIAHGTFRSVISKLYMEKMIQRNDSHKIHTYRLSTHGKKVLSEHSPYIKTTNISAARNRRIRLARLNAVFEGVNISTVLKCNPPVKNIANTPNELRDLCFYNSYFLKPCVTDYTENIRRAKAFGLLTGRNRFFMVYYEPQAKELFFEEEMFKISVSEYIGTHPNNISMLLVVDTPEQAAYWIHFLMHFSEFFNGERPTGLYDSVTLLVADEMMFSSFETIYHDLEIVKHFYNGKLPKTWDSATFSCETDEEKVFHMPSLCIGRLMYLYATSEFDTNCSIRIITTQYLYCILRPVISSTSIKYEFYESEMIIHIIEEKPM